MLKTIIIFTLIFIPGVVFSAQFDMWNTGMTLSEVVETARQHNVPIRRSGAFIQNTNFDKRFIDDKFWAAQEVGYITTLLGQGAKVVLKIHPERPRRVYEIGIHFVGKSSSKEFKSELLNMLTEKYGRPVSVLLSLRKAYRWEPAAGDEILLTMHSFPLLSYSDVGLKAHALKQMGYKEQNLKHGYTKRESGKF